jgi:hypothetical protein
MDEDFVRLIIPELQRRGLFHDNYEGPTLGENLGLAIAPIPDRRGEPSATAGATSQSAMTLGK